MSDDLEIRLVSAKVGRLACRLWHYTHTLPATRHVYGFYRGATFDGIVAFRPNFAHKDTQGWWRKVFGAEAIAELCRIALRPQSERPPTTRYISLAVAEMRRLGYEGIGSYADAGQGHTGGVYRAASWVDLGMSRDSEIYYENGRWTHARSFSLEGRPYPRIFKASHKHRFGIGLTRRARKAVLRWADSHPAAPPRPTKDGGVARRARWTGPV